MAGRPKTKRPQTKLFYSPSICYEVDYGKGSWDVLGCTTVGELKDAIREHKHLKHVIRGKGELVKVAGKADKEMQYLEKRFGIVDTYKGSFDINMYCPNDLKDDDVSLASLIRRVLVVESPRGSASGDPRNSGCDTGIRAVTRKG
eukprot:g4170.t1